MPHIHDHIDFTVEAFLVHRNRVLLRYHDKYDRWLSVGGHIELDEDPIQALRREVNEEVGHSNIEIYREHLIQSNLPAGADVTELIPPLFMNRHRINQTHEHVTLTYGAYTNTFIITPRESIVTAHRWCTLENLAQMNSDGDLSPQTHFYATSILSRLQK